MSKELSIIVPVYNVEKYIDKCLNSLVNQTMDNYEIIIVVDGSKDNSIEFVKKYQKQYPFGFVTLNCLTAWKITSMNGLFIARKC